MIQGFPKKRNCHKTYTVCCGGCLVDRTINECSLAVMKLLDKEKIGDILVKVKGCKVSKEDCVFNKCNKWGECKLLVEAIVDYMKEGVDDENSKRDIE